MAFYQVFLPGGVAAGVEVATSGIIVHAAPILKKSVGLRFERFSSWVKGKGGEIFPVKEFPAEVEKEKLE